jgi:hypothetical protein
LSSCGLELELSDVTEGRCLLFNPFESIAKVHQGVDDHDDVVPATQLAASELIFAHKPQVVVLFVGRVLQMSSVRILVRPHPAEVYEDYVGRLDTAESFHLDVSIQRNHHVVWLDIAMEIAKFVNVL